MKEWECDIDDGDGTGGLANAKNRETATHMASGDSRDGRAGTRRGTAGTGEPNTRATTHCRAAGDGEMTRTKETNGEGNMGGDEGDEGHRDVGATAEHRVENRKCLPPRRRGQAGGKKVRRNIGGGQAARSDTEDQGAGLGGTVKGRAAEGATRSNTEDRGAGLEGIVKGRTAEGAGRSHKKKKKTTRRVREEANDTSSDSSSGNEMEQEVRRVIQERERHTDQDGQQRRDHQ